MLKGLKIKSYWIDGSLKKQVVCVLGHLVFDSSTTEKKLPSLRAVDQGSGLYAGLKNRWSFSDFEEISWFPVLCFWGCLGSPLNTGAHWAAPPLHHSLAALMSRCICLKLSPGLKFLGFHPWTRFVDILRYSCHWTGKLLLGCNPLGTTWSSFFELKLSNLYFKAVLVRVGLGHYREGKNQLTRLREDPSMVSWSCASVDEGGEGHQVSGSDSDPSFIPEPWSPWMGFLLGDNSGLGATVLMPLYPHHVNAALCSVDSLP